MPRSTVRETSCNSPGVLRLSSTLLIARQVPVTFRPRHLQGFRSRWGRYPLGSCVPRDPTRLCLAGALLRFSLQRFSPSLLRSPSPKTDPHGVGASGLLDFRALFSEDPSEPRLLDPLLGFSPSGPSTPPPTTMLSRVAVPPCASLMTPLPRERHRRHSEVCSATRSAFL